MSDRPEHGRPLGDAIDALIDRPGDDGTVAEVEAAILAPGAEGSLRVLRAVRLDTALARAVRTETEEARLSRLLARDAVGRRYGRGRRSRAYPRVIAAATAMTACLAVAAIVWATRPAALAGRFVAVSEGATWKSAAATAGDVIRAGDGIAIESGFATLALGDGVDVDVVGPIRIDVLSETRIRLRRGLLAGRVGPNGRGFTVATDDGEVIDLGTEFLVHKSGDTGTQVRVREGLVRAALRGPDGEFAKVFDLSADESARLDRPSETFDRLDGLFDAAAAYAPVEAAKGCVRRFGGAAKPLSGPVVGLDFRPEEFLTSGSVYVIPENRSVAGDAVAAAGLPAGETVDSYLFHFDVGKGHDIAAVGEGAVTFARPIVAVLTDEAGLVATDAAVATPGSRFAPVGWRGVEPGEDVVTVSADRRTVTFDLRIESGRSLDQFRVLVRGTPE